jgi:transcriptional regulator with XRE-family HTH domain
MGHKATPHSDEFIDQVYKAMVAKNWNMSDLARASGVDQSFLSRRFNGRKQKQFSFENGMRLAAALGIEPYTKRGKDD